MKTNPSQSVSNKPLFFITTVLLLLFLAAMAALVYQNQQLQSLLSVSKPSPSPTVSPASPSSASTPAPHPSSLPSPSPLPSLPQLPIVVFGSPLASSDYSTQKAEIQQKIIDPFTDYYQNLQGKNYVVSLMIETQSDASLKDQYPYTLNAIMSDASHQGELLMKGADGLNWWLPTCMGPCDYSPAFKAKYPQIVSQTNP